MRKPLHGWPDQHRYLTEYFTIANKIGRQIHGPDRHAGLEILELIHALFDGQANIEIAIAGIPAD
jgi:hypothetical protein